MVDLFSRGDEPSVSASGAEGEWKLNSCWQTLFLLLMSGVVLLGCQKRTRDRTELYTQQLESQKTQTDSLRSGMRSLDRMTPLNRDAVTKEVRLDLNTWITTVDRTTVNYSPSPMLNGFDQDMLNLVGSASPIELQYSYWDIDYLFERRLMKKLSDWIAQFPLRDSLVAAALDAKQKELSPEDAVKLEDACKLFDWTIRNLALDPQGASVEELTTDPSAPIEDNQIGYGYLPWETLLFSSGDFVERGRVFSALANQRGIQTAWVSFGATDGPGKLWCIVVVAGDSLLLFDPKLAMPILDPDTGNFATLEEARTNERVLRRLDLPGQFDYAVNPGDLESIQLLVDLPPAAASARMKMLETALLQDERMVLFHDLEQIRAKFNELAPEAKVRLWELPLFAQVQADSVRKRLQSITDFTLAYMAAHGVWTTPNPAALGRLAHLLGKFENTLEEKGALSMYMDTRIDEQSIARLEYDPSVQQELGIMRNANQSMEEFQMYVRQMQFILRKAKVDASFLMSQLHFDRGSYDAAESWFRDRVVESENSFAEPWRPISRYCLARIYQERGDLEKATEQLTFQPSPQEAGNRLRLRYLRRMLEQPNEN